MTDLQRTALKTEALPPENVQGIYNDARPETAVSCLRALCRSHERLRTENLGLQTLLDAANEDAERLRARLAAALALTDTGSAEFKAAFSMAHSSGLPVGWRVVERIREVLLG